MTPTGLAKRAAAEAGGVLLAPTELAVGDGGGVYHEPEALLGGLVNEVWRGPVNKIYVHQVQDNLVVIEAKIPPDLGGWDIREAAIYDSAGALIAVGKYPLTVKPAPGSGGEKEIIVRGGLRVSNGGDVVLQIDASLVMASQEYVDAHALLTAPHQATSAPTALRMMTRDVNGCSKVGPPLAADDIARKDTVDAALAALVAASPAALDTLNELAAALGDDPNFATTMTTALAGKETPAGAQVRVDAHNALTSPHSATATPIGNRLAKYDAAGRLEAIYGIAGNDVINYSQWSAAKGAGVEQSWAIPTVTNGVTYRNTTGRPITVCVRSSDSGSSGSNYYFDIWVGVSSADTLAASGTATLGHQTVTVIVPNNHYYKFNGASSVKILS
jgi:phage-related tail fiber protein